MDIFSVYEFTYNKGDPTDGCTDIDECSNPDACGANEVCTNNVGGFECACAAGFSGNFLEKYK